MAIEAGYIQGATGRLFSTYFRPAAAGVSATLFCPAFAEEMNKSRRMMALTADALARAGHACLIVDLFGTGDSEGDFSDARWQGWVSDLIAAMSWLQDRLDGPINLVGVRLGACLAMDLTRQSDVEIKKLVLWQPTLRGQVFMTQFLRLKVASDLTGAGGGATTAGLREEAIRKGAVEISGYEIGSELLQAIDEQRIAGTGPPTCESTSILEVSSSQGLPLTAGTRRLVAEWSENGADVRSRAVSGDQFWAAAETVLVPDLIEATVTELCGAG